MAISSLSIQDFLNQAKQHPVLDVRSPGEYSHAHIPGAHTLPLFSDDERRVVGTAYKQEGRQPAIKLGLAYFGKKMVNMVDEVAGIIAQQEDRETPSTGGIVLVHCWRGGMRSAGVAWLLDLYGFTVYTLKGGYKAYRNWVLEQFLKTYPLRVIGGYTGSGKTELLHALSARGESIIDLEALARHRGSAFGNMEKIQQPTQEMFENELAESLYACRAASPIWIEDESQRIGLVNLPGSFLSMMRGSELLLMEIPFEERLDHIVKGYGHFDPLELEAAIIRIKKRLGGLQMKQSVEMLQAGNVRECFRILLTYYDKSYRKALQSWEEVGVSPRLIASERVDAEHNASLIMQHQIKTLT